MLLPEHVELNKYVSDVGQHPLPQRSARVVFLSPGSQEKGHGETC